MQMIREDQLTGKTLGEYSLERLLGHGQLSAVYLARHMTRGQVVMVTVFNYPTDDALRKQYSVLFRREAAALVRLQHPNILPTCDYGEQDGQPYLVTTYVKGASLAQALKQQERFTVIQTLAVFKQLAAGLDEAHSKGVTHGILSLSNVLMASDLEVQLAGFGLKSILEMQVNTHNRQPQAHLFSANGIFLGNPAYISPERVMGMAIDARSDIYALGIILFEMLSGKLPFQASTPLETALMRIQQPVPSLHQIVPDLPEAFDLLISKALERDPARRYQHAGEIAASFERVTRILDSAALKGAVSKPQSAQVQDAQITLPPTINWFDEDRLSTGKWQLMPPIVTGHLAAVTPGSGERARNDAAASTPPQTGPLADQPTTATSGKLSAIAQPNRRGDSLAGIDPFAWWTGHAARNQSPTPGTFPHRSPVRLAKKGTPGLQERRRAVKLIATGGAVAGVLAVGGISFAHFAQSLKNSPSLTTTAPTTKTGATATTSGNTPTSASTSGASTQKTATPTQSATAHPSPTQHAGPSPTAQPTQQPTQQPTPKPTQPPPTPTPSHTGTVIGNTNMPNNSSVKFTNPADGQSSLLIRLANGNFVACERACTHEGVAVDYNSGQQQLVCPAHNAIFDPANHFNHTSGPGGGQLPSVSIRVNADGTITTG